MTAEVSLESADNSAGGRTTADAARKKVTDETQKVLEGSLTWSEVNSAINTQARVIHALILRETLSRYGDHKMGFMWAIVEPLLMVAIIAGLMSATRSDAPNGMPLVPFMISGFVPFFMFRNTMNQLKGAVSSNRTMLGFPQVTTFDVIVARVLLESGVLLFVYVFILSMAYLLGFEFKVQNPLGMLAVCLGMLLMGTGFGFVFAVLTPIIPSSGLIANLLFGRPLMLTSGLFYTASSIPEPYRGWLLYNPLLHMMELMRTYFFYEFESNYGSWTYAGSWVVGMFAFGMLTHQALRKRAIVGL